MEKVLVIVGPTAVGKTSLSIDLAKKFNGEIISGDSLQVYRTLDIGTAKVTEKEKERIPHYLIDVKDPNENYSVAEFQKEARKKIVDITATGKLPIVVGGTGLYIQSLLWDYQLGKAETDHDLQLRKKYEIFAEKNGKSALWGQLKALDPLAAEKIHFNNQKKVIRALEVFELTGRSIFSPEKTPKLLYNPMIIGLNTERKLLYQRINQRVDQMINDGLLDEAEKLFVTPTVQAAQGIGYKELFPYFRGEQSLTEATEEIKLQSRRYAKRQLTWFRNRMPVVWYDLVQQPETITNIENAVATWLKEG
ncbi:tRNA (adenosine(37)-N6)-dimethylallyltransferase MiaA [Enterococcus alishanensis]|uniref:tRNA dimethylallyltransferase n=1 Tax=Enterococcus alishanensis TaxID=1303817 RepID=A0ABS6T9D2_9ENTE|nr:tRNA (adenosine(37)-N6)-dimethylallyltransferase MiaA [Enterococcus alishanensis]MBV7389512.1 tRNA (adenosine(37)-N6)-dimethylallyltransferase MiaA [Enterococcus alishanensis]